MLWLLLTPRTGAAAVLTAQQLGILEQGDFQHKWSGFPWWARVGLAQQSRCFCVSFQVVLESGDAICQV